jgi:hypothetical protein
MTGQPEEQAPATSPAGATPINYICSLCSRPAEWNGQGWQHAEPADTVFCSIFANTGADDA